MAIGWMTILQSVPWTDVIRNAPKVAEGARKLWNKVGGKVGRAEEVITPSINVDQTPAAQIVALQAQVEALHGQMLASSEVIQALAEQNTQLIARIETHRRRMLWLAVGNAVAFLMAVAAWLH